MDVDVVVIGMGPGGEDLGGRLARGGLDVVGIDRELLGGECPYWGCIPSKMMTRAAGLLAEARRIPGLAGEASVRADWAPVARRIREEATHDWDDRAAVERFERAGGRFVRGEGRLVAPGRVAVDDQEIRARRAVVIATGTRPTIPPIPGLDHLSYWTNRDAIAVEDLPRSLIVLGGGAVGAELAQVFARFGVEVTVVEAADRLLPRDEPEAGHVLADVFRSEGIAVHTAAKVVRVRADGAGTAADLADGTTIASARLLVATGRRADVAGLGLATVGVDESERWVPVDEHLRVSDGVWAVGDITGQGAFTHVAMYQSRIAAADILGLDHAPADYRALPRVTFTDPEVGAVGLSEEQARIAGLDVRTATADMATTTRGWIHHSGNDGFIKLVEDADRGVLVGATTMGPAGGEVIGLLTLAVHAEVNTEHLGRMMYAYPTFHRGVQHALDHLSLARLP